MRRKRNPMKIADIPKPEVSSISVEVGMIGIKTDHSDEAIRTPMIKPDEPWPTYGVLLFSNIARFIRLRRNHHALIYGNLIPVFADNIVLAFLRRSSKQTLLVIINIGLELLDKTIPRWNQNLEERKLIDILNQDDHQEYCVQNNQLHIPKLYPYWGKILLLNE
jgi:hypothetical protein